MLGIRFFSGIGFVVAAIIFVLLVFSVRLTTSKLITAFGLALLASVFQYLKGSSVGYCALVTLYVINAVFLVYYVQGHEIRADFKAALKVFVIQAFLSALAYLFVPNNFLIDVNWNDAMLQSKSLFYMFYYNAGERHMLPFLPLPRITGWAWEPGCLQLIVNLYICLEIFDTAKIEKLIIPTIVIILTASTSGYIVWAVNVLLYILTSNAKRFFIFIPIACIMGVMLLPLMVANVEDKFGVGGDVVVGTGASGAVRIRDFYTGIEEIKQYPLFGIDVSDLANSVVYQHLEDDGLSHVPKLMGSWRSVYDYAAGGYCNGFFAMHMFWGAFGLLMLLWFIKCRLWKELSYGRYWQIFPVIISLTLISEPISNSSFFFFFCFYNVISNNKKHAYIYSNSYIQRR